MVGRHRDKIFTSNKKKKKERRAAQYVRGYVCMLYWKGFPGKLHRHAVRIHILLFVCYSLLRAPP